MTLRMITRKRLKNINDVKEFTHLLERIILSDEERTIMQLHYLKGYTLLQISYELGYSEVTICRKHGRILDKVQKLFESEQTD